ncbi:MAG: hypothetical protein NC041_07115 [Bacteroides sp.]|nr:hypothetical protein [Prevotella sp.]MCM1407067.1 hypothetical protein [Treponema brennaborense]MCM1470219.1 hypothetical protein [Bacteroides sp.]
MGGRKILITVTEEQHEALERSAAAQGLSRVSTLVKSAAIKSVQNEIAPDSNRKTMLVPVTNYRELADYVESKKFGSIESFATFAMEQYMTKYPVSARKKAGTEN